jgi:hypothetical protein
MFKLIGTITNGSATLITEIFGIFLPLARGGRKTSEGFEKDIELDQEVKAHDRQKRRMAFAADLAAFEKQLALEPTVKPADLKKAA